MFNIKELCDLFGTEYCDGKNSDIKILSVEHDTRRLKKNSLYVAINGDNFDGHDFVKEAVAKGAVACIVEKHIADVAVAQFVVKSTVKAYGQLASYWRSKIKYPLIAITGSNGKTTTKDMLYSVLSFKNKTVKTNGNFNNLIGVPYTILSFPLDAEFGIVEMGMNAKGEIKQLAQITKADVGLITNIGRAHVGLLGSIEAVFSAKMELFDEVIKDKGAVCVNVSDPLISKWFNGIKLSTPFITCGIENNKTFMADIKAIPLGFKDGVEKFKVIFKNNVLEAEIPVLGVHNIQNACSAITIGVFLGLNIKDCVESVKEYEGSKLRSLIVKKDGVTYFIDCYNANPDSMKAALKSISEQKTSGRKVAVLGDMLELDLLSDELHYEIGYFAGLKGFDMVFAYGNYSQKYAEGFIDAVGNVKNISLYNFGDVQKLKKDLNAFLKNGDLVIIKGSRGMKLEEILSV